MATDPKKKAQTKAKSQAKRQVKKVARKNPGLVIALVAILVVIVVVAAVLYLKVPAVHDAVTNIISQEASSNKGANNNKTSNLPVLERGEGELKIYFIDIGQGDCIYIQFPDNDNTDMLIDCGYKDPNAVTKTSIPTNVLEYLTALNPDGTIEHLMLTHGDQDHVSCMDEILDTFQINNIYMPNIKAAPGTSSKHRQELQAQIDSFTGEKINMFADPNMLDTVVYAEFFVRALTEPNCTIHLNVDENDEQNSIVISDNSTYNLTFYCMTAADWAKNTLSSAYEKNNISPVGILTYNNKRIVLTGDSNGNLKGHKDGNEPKIAERIGYIDCDVLKVAHHGSDTSSTQVFLDAVTCEYAVFCCGENTYGHPTQDALDRMASFTAIYRTDLNGTIVLTVNANGDLSFEVEKEATQEQERVGADVA